MSKSDTVSRDPLYQNEVVNEKCAVMIRLAPSLIRFGSFEVPKEEKR